MRKENHQGTVVVGMSGGVDSSVVALLLLKQGYDVVGLHMRGENTESRDADEKRVRELCEFLGIKCEVVDYDDHMQIVKDYFISEYKSGRTPNPCVVCNREVKFKPFIDFARRLGAYYFATGHYASIEHGENGHILKKAVDAEKDQTYFLCQLSQHQLEKALFPLGSLTKSEVREIARENGLVSSETKDSYDICFLGSEKFKTFMQENYPESDGDIVHAGTGKIVGRHTGISKYTIGQRRGLGIGGGHGNIGEGWFVVGKDMAKNQLLVAQGDGEELLSSALVAKQVNWIPRVPENKEFCVTAKFRYRQKEQKVNVKIREDGSVYVTFAEKQRAVTPGQYVVFYDGDKCLGGGTIDEVIK
ncbi:MAG: tRNA 2-thiouridine(34) synthase MnmA [Clostridia bacterium]|nr:tRNA 2-thiouridine(34) synthase MnmA [Clostridia bacterium]